MSKTPFDQAGSTVRTDRILAAATAAAALLVYALTLAPTVSFWDSGEYITCSWVMGIPHPPGVPFFILIGRFSTLLFSFLPEVAARVNLLCGVAGVAAVGIMTRLLQRWCNRMGFSPGFYRPVSLTAGLLGAFSYTLWRNHNATETYAMALLLTVLILWVFDLWIERRLRGIPAGRQLLLVGYLMALSIGNHLSALIVVAPIALMYLLYAIRGRTHEWRSPGFILSFIGLMLLAFSVHLYMPLRAIQQPEVNETDPSRYPAFRDALERKQYGQVSIFARKGPFLQQLGLYAKYHSWQTGRPEAWHRTLGPGGERLGTGLWIALSMAGIAGLVVLGKRRPDLLLLVGGTFFMASFAFVVYLNFKTGPEGTLAGEVRERDYFFGASFALFALLSALGAGVFIRSLGGKRALWAMLLLPLAALAVNWHHCDRSGDYVARDYGINLLESCEPNAVLITNGDNDTFPLWFAQGVLGVRRDVVVSNLSLMNTPWYTHQLISRDSLLLSYPTAIVDSLRPVYIWGPNFFHVSRDGYPVTSIMDRTILDSTFTGSWPWVVTRDSLCIPVPSMGIGFQGSLSMQELLLLDMVKRVPIHGRPVYLAATVSRDNRIYLEEYLVMEGIAFRVMDSPAKTGINPERSQRLLQQYLYTGLDDPGVYKDDQAVQIARNYVSGFHQLAGHYMSVGDAEASWAALEAAAGVFTAMPADWLLLLPVHTYHEARWISGVHGPMAARNHVIAVADSLDALSTQNYGRDLRRLADEYVQLEALIDFADSLSDGSPAQEWLLIEIELSFGNFLGARSRFAEIETLHPDDPALPLIASTIDSHTLNVSLSGGILPHQTALAEVLGYIDARPEPSAADIILHMADLASEGRTMTALCIGSVMSSIFPDQCALAGDYSRRMAAFPREQTRNAYWFSLAVKSIPPDVLVELCLKADLPELAHAVRMKW